MITRDKEIHLVVRDLRKQLRELDELFDSRECAPSQPYPVPMLRLDKSLRKIKAICETRIQEFGTDDGYDEIYQYLVEAFIALMDMEDDK